MANKIQVRRGLKANLPALSVGELALCTDTNELYIGASSGNVKVNIDTIYTHPANHPASIITQDANNRFMTDAERTKLSGIATGAQVNTVTSVASKTGAVALVKGDVGLGNADNTSDANKPVSTAQQTALNLKEDKANKGVANGYAGLDSNTKLLLANMPDFMLGQMLNAGTVNVATAVATLTTNGKTKLGTANATITLTNNTTAVTGYLANQGNYYVVSTAGTFANIVFDVGDWLVATASGWGKIDNTDAVVSVAGRTGAVVLTKTDVGLGNVDNTSDANKPVSTAQQTALNNKVDKATGKQLSTEDFTATLLSKLNGIATGANKTGNNKAATKTVGLADAGYTADDVDILIPAGTANCKTYLDQAVSAIPAAGGKIILLNGTYNFGSPWVIERSNITIEGMGASTILNMNGARNTTTTAAAAKSNNAVIYVSGNNNIISNLQVTTPDTAGYSYGIYLNSSSSNTITGNICNNSSGGNSCHGIYLNSSSNNNITSNICSNIASSSNSHGIYLNSSSSNTITGNICSNIASTDLSYGISLYSSSNNNIITGNICRNDSVKRIGHGIILNSSSNNTITGNICSNSAGGSCYGIGLYSSSNNNIITGNICSNIAGGDSSQGIYLYSSSNNNIITGNEFSNSHITQTTSNTFALYIATAGSYNQITNNNLSGVTRAASPGSAYTTNGVPATIPGTPTTVVSFGTGGVIGFNVA